jgi:hypothetical protein
MEFEKRLVANEIYEETKDLEFYLGTAEAIFLLLFVSGGTTVLFDMISRIDVVKEHDVELYGLIFLSLVSFLYSRAKLEDVENLRSGIKQEELDLDLALSVIGQRKYYEIVCEVREKIEEVKKRNY